jgi:3-methyl-2-oxobutanoate hydroxymethyltransferase
MSKYTAEKITALKGKSKISALTAYDCITARLVDGAGMQIVLVGDSLGMAVLGYDTTLPVTMADMLHHTAAVVRGVENALVVADMPFMSYQVSEDQAVQNAGRFVKEAGADAVKLEGGSIRAPVIRRLLENGIPVLGHIGLTPQSVKSLGGYKIQGKKPEQAEQLLKDAANLEDAGAFGVVLECVPAALAKEITRAVSIPTIGIGAGPDCDGQILVLHDLLGLQGEDAPSLKFVKQYAKLGQITKDALVQYRGDVERGLFPSGDHSF